MQNYQLLLASTSPFRQQLLNKLAVPFSTVEPNCDETPFVNETPIELVQRLAKQKAESCQTDGDCLIIGSDQVCVIDGEIVGKPLSHQNAIEQLTRQSGKAIQFYTGLALHNTKTKQTQVCLDTFTVHFRHLSEQQIARYVEKEQPYYCAGSFKSEGLGIALFERLEGKDPNTLVGLPLIDLIDLLEQQGFAVL
ncbi:septum formation inhibitor Maf [Vibrio sinensis]|uniref:7-methyl-GTP pyrophosphatase n=1 Tax=Vibrio sinensis TaxID=2302434 RepID=A0A3A6QSW2_9VIBR|nr:nucleoside triphosphate pyrophosphatase [Vibrio sinensis]RJX72057.1 septum formation inhibitor Maf [Vibrio sinensis]